MFKEGVSKHAAEKGSSCGKIESGYRIIWRQEEGEWLLMGGSNMLESVHRHKKVVVWRKSRVEGVGWREGSSYRGPPKKELRTLNSNERALEGRSTRRVHNPH
jgi:hypothetical protein